MLRIFILLLSLGTFGCDIADFKYSESPKHDDSKVMEDKETEVEGAKPRLPKIVTMPKNNEYKQDPKKDFNAVSTTITRGKPIHSFPKSK